MKKQDIDGRQARAACRQPASRCLWLLACSLTTVFIYGQFLLAIEQAPSSDDAMFLSVPKNWINGYGWATSYSDKIPFNPDLTAGASLLLPAAGLIRVFGNMPWIAGATGFLINTVLLLCSIRQFRHYWPNPAAASIALLCACVAANAQDYSSLIGYYSGSLLFLLTTLTLFNPAYAPTTKAICLGTATAIAMHIKILLLPAFLVLTLLFLVRERKPKYLAIAAIPLFLLQGSWQLFQQHGLHPYSATYLDVREDYGKEFALYHGSGIGQWQDAQDKTEHVKRTVNKNLYLVEEVLKEYGICNPFNQCKPDPDHAAGKLFTLFLLFAFSWSLWQTLRQPKDHTRWFFSTGYLAILAYHLWFVLFSFSMTPGHYYFCKQWSLLWMLSHSIHATFISGNKLTKTTALFLCITVTHTVWLKKDIAEEIFLSARKTTPNTEYQRRAITTLTELPKDLPMAGCGYSGYPRHLEYLLPTSENFEDCFDLIEDSVTLDENYFFDNRITADGSISAIEHFHQNAKSSKLIFNFRWKNPVSFFHVVSLQSLGQRNVASDIIHEACKKNMAYRNDEIVIFRCKFSDLQLIDLNKLMREIALNQRWYKTRLQPYEGRSFETLRQGTVSADGFGEKSG